MEFFGQNGIDYKKDHASQDVVDPAYVSPFYKILLEGKAHGHTGNSGPHGPWDTEKGCN